MAARVGAGGESYGAGFELSDAVRASVQAVVHEVLPDLDPLDAGFVRRCEEAEPDIWWEEPLRALAV